MCIPRPRPVSNQASAPVRLRRTPRARIDRARSRLPQELFQTPPARLVHRREQRAQIRSRAAEPARRRICTVGANDAPASAKRNCPRAPTGSGTSDSTSAPVALMSSSRTRVRSCRSHSSSSGQRHPRRAPALLRVRRMPALLGRSIRFSCERGSISMEHQPSFDQLEHCRRRAHELHADRDIAARRCWTRPASRVARRLERPPRCRRRLKVARCSEPVARRTNDSTCAPPRPTSRSAHRHRSVQRACQLSHHVESRLGRRSPMPRRMSRLSVGRPYSRPPKSRHYAGTVMVSALTAACDNSAVRRRAVSWKTPPGPRTSAGNFSSGIARPKRSRNRCTTEPTALSCVSISSTDDPPLAYEPENIRTAKLASQEIDQAINRVLGPRPARPTRRRPARDCDRSASRAPSLLQSAGQSRQRSAPAPRVTRTAQLAAPPASQARSTEAHTSATSGASESKRRVAPRSYLQPRGAIRTQGERSHLTCGR